MNDLDIILDQKNIIHKGKAPGLVPGLGHGADGSLVSAKVRVQPVNHQCRGPDDWR